MRVLLLVAFGALAVSAANLRLAKKEPADVGKTVAAALKTMEKVQSANRERTGKVAEACSKEIEETKKWVDAGHGIDSKDRAAAKQALADALKNRIDGLKKFLGKLKSIRKRLRTHVLRVNVAFGTKYTENDNAMKAAKSAVDPAAGLKLLKLPQMEADTTEDKAEMASAAATPAAAEATSFLEMHESTISQLAQQLYDTAMANSKMTRENIEKERSTLGEFRNKLRALILKREAKLAKLTKQMNDIKKALETNESFAKDVWPYLEEHYKTTQASCSMMTASFKTASAEEADIVAAINSGPSTNPVDSPAPIEAVADGGLGKMIQ
jgi:hypothetical protein